MRKLLKWHDTYTLKILISFLIFFTALYPKLPSVHIPRTWVYIRLEDFFIFGTALIWFVQLLRKKVVLPRVFAVSIGIYWTIGLISLGFSLLFIAPQLSGFFPHVALLSFLRRVEYMILFFVAFSTVRSRKDVRDYFVIFAVTVFAVFLYGLGQRYYLRAWEMNPDFFRKYSFCFPSFQTGNEEFAKGLPLCLPANARITSTFGGSYDLAAYMVLALPIILGVFVAAKRWFWKVATALVFIAGLMLLVFTAQRAAYISYIFGSVAALIFYKKKLYIIPVLIISIVFLLAFSGSTAKRFLATFRISNVVVDSQGRLIGEALPEDLKNKIKEPTTAELPKGSAFIGLPQGGSQVGTSSAMVQRGLTPEEAKRLQLAEGSLQISTVTGSFLVKKALVYDISFTTRFQAEWPNAWRAFQRNLLLGSGYSSITLATDNDYFRALGETGLLGLTSFLGIFLVLWIALKKLTPEVKSPLVLGFAYGVAGGTVGLFFNALLIDVFEASKVAENLWILLGIGAGGLAIHQTTKVAYWEEIKRVLTTNKAYITYLFFVVAGVFFVTARNFFVADDFTWLKWAATARFSDLPSYFTDSQNFFYRPLDKVVTFFLYAIFSFQPSGYHLFLLFLHFLGVVAVYQLVKKIYGENRWVAFSVAVLFALVPAHTENILWYSGLSSVLSSVFMLYGVLCFLRFRMNKSKMWYVATILLTLLAFFSYEIAVVTPLLLVIADIFITRVKKNKYFYFSHLPFFAMIPLYHLARVLTHAFYWGGDYRYNLLNFVPNVIGNFFGYIGMFFFSENFLPLYTMLRSDLRNSTGVIALMAGIIFAALVVTAYFMRKGIAESLKLDSVRFILFGFAFAFVGLIPYLPLGNIAPRYLYLASFGLCFSFVLLLRQIFRNRYLVFAGILLLTVWFVAGNMKLQKDWKRAGEITKSTLALFRVEYEELSGKDNIYFVDTPIKHNNVWVFPLGLEDGMWFIYRDRMPKLHQVKTVADAEADIAKKKTRNNYIFEYDKNGNISRVK